MTNNPIYDISDIIVPKEIHRDFEDRVVLDFGVTDLFRDYKERKEVNQRLLDSIVTSMKDGTFNAYKEGSLVLHHLSDDGVMTIPASYEEWCSFPKKLLNLRDDILITQGLGYHKEFIFLAEDLRIYAEISKSVSPGRAAILLDPFIDDYNIEALDVICRYISTGAAERYSFDAAGTD